MLFSNSSVVDAVASLSLLHTEAHRIQVHAQQFPQFQSVFALFSHSPREDHDLKSERTLAVDLKLSFGACSSDFAASFSPTQHCVCLAKRNRCARFLLLSKLDFAFAFLVHFRNSRNATAAPAAASSPKDELLRWVNTQIRPYNLAEARCAVFAEPSHAVNSCHQVVDFSTSFKSGRVLAALLGARSFSGCFAF